LARLLAGLTAQLLFAKAPAMEQLLVRLAAVDRLLLEPPQRARRLG
jgi:hypothetical protein